MQGGIGQRLLFAGRCQPGQGQRARQGSTGRFGKLGEAFGHLGQRGLVEDVPPVDQPVTRFTDKTDPLGDPGEPRDERGLEGIGQHIDPAVVPGAQRARQPETGAERQFAVGEGVVDDLGDFRHALQYRRDPARRQGVDHQPFGRGLQAGEQDLRHDGVADPGRGDDQDAFGRYGRMTGVWQNGGVPVTVNQCPLGASPVNT